MSIQVFYHWLDLYHHYHEYSFSTELTTYSEIQYKSMWLISSLSSLSTRWEDKILLHHWSILIEFFETVSKRVLFSKEFFHYRIQSIERRLIFFLFFPRANGTLFDQSLENWTSERNTISRSISKAFIVELRTQWCLHRLFSHWSLLNVLPIMMVNQRTRLSNWFHC